jgi:hypothetical protein
MRALLAAALGAALVTSAGCSLAIDPDSVDPPVEKEPRPPPRGACVGAPGGHELCGGAISAGARVVTSAGHVLDGWVGTPAPRVSSSQHAIVRGEVGP